MNNSVRSIGSDRQNGGEFRRISLGRGKRGARRIHGRGHGRQYFDFHLDTTRSDTLGETGVLIKATGPPPPPRTPSDIQISNPHLRSLRPARWRQMAGLRHSPRKRCLRSVQRDVPDASKIYIPARARCGKFRGVNHLRITGTACKNRSHLVTTKTWRVRFNFYSRLFPLNYSV